VSSQCGTTAQRGRSLRHQHVDAPIVSTSHVGNVSTAARSNNSPEPPGVDTSPT